MKGGIASFVVGLERYLAKHPDHPLSAEFLAKPARAEVERSGHDTMRSFRTVALPELMSSYFWAGGQEDNTEDYDLDDEDEDDDDDYDTSIHHNDWRKMTKGKLCLNDKKTSHNICTVPLIIISHINCRDGEGEHQQVENVAQLER